MSTKTHDAVALNVHKAVAATIKANPEASHCACIRAVASEIQRRKLQVRRQQFIEGVTNWVTPGTASRQYFEGRHH